MQTTVRQWHSPGDRVLLAIPGIELIQQDRCVMVPLVEESPIISYFFFKNVPLLGFTKLSGVIVASNMNANDINHSLFV